MSASEADSLGRHIVKFIASGRADSVVVERGHLAEMFGDVPSLDYCDWLNRFGLRQLKMGRVAVELGLQVPPESAVSA